MVKVSITKKRSLFFINIGPTTVSESDVYGEAYGKALILNLALQSCNGFNDVEIVVDSSALIDAENWACEDCSPAESARRREIITRLNQSNGKDAADNFGNEMEISLVDHEIRKSFKR